MTFMEACSQHSMSQRAPSGTPIFWALNVGVEMESMVEPAKSPGAIEWVIVSDSNHAWVEVSRHLEAVDFGKKFLVSILSPQNEIILTSHRVTVRI